MALFIDVGLLAGFLAAHVERARIAIRPVANHVAFQALAARVAEAVFVVFDQLA
ncbi:hypothetical protein D3C71_2068720 [compost metagenome]